MTGKIVRIGGAAAHWLDSSTAVPQLLRDPPHYLMLDYLSEGAMSVFARIMQQYPEGGFPPDFVSVHIGPHIGEIMAKGVKIVANAGGLNPEACAAALEQVARAAGVSPRIAIVRGDDLRGRADEFRLQNVPDMFHGTPALLPDALLSLNAYLGAFPIAAALGAGADIVITGRVSDSALALGPLIHEFGWGPGDHDLLSAGTLAGHVLECGCHSTGGTFTDWRDVADGWEDMGFPVAEVRADGSFILTKPDGTGGLVSRGTVAEQILYEVSDPQCYFVSDVVCDWSEVELTEVGPNRVEVRGARGYAPTGSYKVIATFEAGWRAMLASPIVGFDAGEKAARQGEALVARSRRLLRERNWPDFTQTRVDVLGAEASYGDNAIAYQPREVVLRVLVDHPMKEGAELFNREQHAAMTAMSVGTTMPLNFVVNPLSVATSFLLPRSAITVQVTIGPDAVAVDAPAEEHFDQAALVRPPRPPLVEDGFATSVPLIKLAWARSGDKGGLFNVGVIARRAEYLSYISAALTEESVCRWFMHTFDDKVNARVDRYEVPGFDAINFVVPDGLGGSILTSNRIDPVAKTMGQQILAMPVPVPAWLASNLQ